MKLILRDDDLSYFADPEELGYLFGEIWDKVTVHFAVIPKVYVHQNETPIDREYDQDYYWIGDNKELVSFLKKRIKEDKVKIWQHGFTHRDYGKRYELERKDENILYNELKEGKEHLEQVFDVQIETLVPPHDRISKEGIRAAEKIGYTYISRGFAPRPGDIQWTRKVHRKAFYKLFWFWLRHGRKRRYPETLDFGSHKEMFNYRVQHLNKKNLPEILQLHEDGVLCVTTHYRTLNEIQKEMIQLIIHHG